MQSFNPHFRKGSDLRKQQAFPICPGFNPYFRKGSDRLWRVIPSRSRSFNPHFRKGSDGSSTRLPCTAPPVSIHTSAREVTVYIFITGGSWGFQSTLPQGKWLIDFQKVTTFCSFNPHFRKGSDPVSVFLRFGRIVSIHTSAREVTIEDGDVRMVSLFQSTLPQGKWLHTLQ